MLPYQKKLLKNLIKSEYFLTMLYSVTSNSEMPYAKVPEESKNKINKAGKILNGSDLDIDLENNNWMLEFSDAWNLADKWTACHAYPINTFQSTLRRKLRSYPKEKKYQRIVAQRLKRMKTIIDKLERYPAMQLTTMQDISGVRAVLPDMKEVEKLAMDYQNSSFSH